MKKLDVERIIQLHKCVINATGGSSEIRDIKLLESAVYAPFATFGGKELFPTITSKAARLCYGIIRNHPFVDGNKRIGILVMITFLELNGLKVLCTDNELIEIGLSLADGSLNDRQLLKWITNHC